MESDQCKLFVGGISRETSEEDLEQHFSKYGVVLGAVVCKEKATGAPRCFGFVRFSDASSAVRALQDPHFILGRTVDVKKAVPKDEQLRSQQQQCCKLQQSSCVHEETSNGNHKTKKIFVGGLASGITEEEFKNYFEIFGRITDAVVMHHRSTNRPRGFGFVTFDSEDCVENVMQKNFHKLNNKRVEVKRAIPKKGIQTSDHSNRDSRFDVGKWYTYNSYQSFQYPCDSARYGMLVHYSPSYAGGHGFPYMMDAYGYGYPLLAHDFSMHITEFYPLPYNNASGYFGYTNNGYNQPDMNSVGHNTILVTRPDGKLTQVIDGHEQVHVGALSPQLEGLKLDVGTSVIEQN